MKKVLALILTAVFSLTLLCACSAPVEQTFTVDDKFRITLDSSFSEQEVEGLSAAFVSNKYGVTVLRETFETLDELGYEGSELSENDYLKLVMAANDLENEITEDSGFQTFTVDNTVENATFTYFGLALKGDDSFWLVQLYCEKDNFEESKPTLIEWAKTITLN